MFQAQINSLHSSTDQYVLSANQSVLNFSQVMELICNNDAFRSFLIQTLIDSPFAAFRFETPPINIRNQSQPFEFVLIDSPWLDRSQDSVPFESYFANAVDQQVVVFNNLGADATLIVPTPMNNAANYAHFAVFLRTASDTQVHDLLLTMARTLIGKLSDRPVWLNTAGGGVDWLHIRCDSSPKYYAHTPYKFH